MSGLAVFRLWVPRGLRRKMKKVSDAPFALTCEGRLLLNVTHTDGARTLPALLRRAHDLEGRVFVGVELTSQESRSVIFQMTELAAEVAAFIAGCRPNRRAE